MIHCALHDGGTVPMLRPDAVPGMDEMYWREGNFEEGVAEDRTRETNAVMQATDPVTMRPWPEPMPRHAWVDWTPRYEADGDDGLRFSLHHVDQITESSALVSAGEVLFTREPQPLLDASEGRLIRALDWREVQARAEDPTEWLRLDTDNESGGTHLKQPLELIYDRLRGATYHLELPDQSLFTPFDLRYPERYRVVTDDGRELSDEEAAQALALRNGGRYRLHLRPRRWRYVATAWAYYALISGFEYVISTEVFTRAHFDRPPFYPYRHDLIESSKTTPLSGWFGAPLSYDEGIESQWGLSRSSQALRLEILDGGFRTLCLVKLFLFATNAEVTVWRYPPQTGEIVLGIDRVDQATGSSSRWWVVAKEDQATEYPATVLGHYLVPFCVGA